MAKITTAYKGDMLFETTIGEHKLTIDVPPDLGGRDRGPMPPQLFIASLGSCVAALIAEYCEGHELSAEGMTVDVEFEKAAKPTRLTNIRVVTKLPNADINGTHYDAALKRVAEHCPVHETIETIEDIDFDIVGKEA